MQGCIADVKKQTPKANVNKKRLIADIPKQNVSVIGISKGKHESAYFSYFDIYAMASKISTYYITYTKFCLLMMGPLSKSVIYRDREKK